MAVTAISRYWSEAPNLVAMVSSDTLATIAGAGYLTAQADNIAAINNGVWVWQASDMVLVFASDGLALFTLNTALTTLVLYSTAGNGAVTLPVVSGNFTVFDGTLGALKDGGFSPSDATKTKVVMAGSAVVVGSIAKFSDTAGTVDDTAGAAVNLGNISAGASGTAGTLISFPATATNGSLILAAINAGGAFNTTISNSVMGQSTVYSLPDIGAATGGIVVSTDARRLKAVDAAAAAGGAAAQSFTDTFSTTTSVIIGNWVTQANAASVLKIVPGNGSFVVTSSADAGVGTFSYIILK